MIGRIEIVGNNTHRRQRESGERTDMPLALCIAQLVVAKESYLLAEGAAAARRFS